MDPGLARRLAGLESLASSAYEMAARQALDAAVLADLARQVRDLRAIVLAQQERIRALEEMFARKQ